MKLELKRSFDPVGFFSFGTYMWCGSDKSFGCRTIYWWKYQLEYSWNKELKKERE